MLGIKICDTLTSFTSIYIQFDIKYSNTIILSCLLLINFDLLNYSDISHNELRIVGSRVFEELSALTEL